MIRVVVASDAPAVREAIAAAIRRERDMELTSATDLAGAAVAVDAESADVAVAQLREADDARIVLGVRCALLIVTDQSTDAWAGLLRAGARGVLPPDLSDERLAAAVRAAAAGLLVVAPQTAAALAFTVADSRLTPRERDVLRLLAAGSGNKAIARRLRISEHTVKFHVASIMTKLDAGSRTEAVTEGIRRGLVML